MIALLQIAGLLHFVIAGANFFAAKLFRYRENMSRVEPFVREVFWVQNGFIIFSTLAMGVLCLRFPHELSNGNVLGRSLSSFFTLFWGLRLVIQVAFYDAGAKKRFSLANRLFTLVFVLLTIVFGVAAFHQTK